MKEPPRPRATAGDILPVTPHHRHASALAQDTAVGAAGSGAPHRSAVRSSQTPRDERHGDRTGRPGAFPPVPGRLISLPALLLAYTLLFGLLTWQEAVRGPLLRIDNRLRPMLAGESVRPVAPAPAEAAADLGSLGVALPVLAAAVACAALRGRRAGVPRWWLPPLAVVLALAAVWLTVAGLKATVGRDGPGSLDLAPGYPGLYPSGHAATAAVAFGGAALLLRPYLRRAAARWLPAAAVLLNGAAGLALVVCGYHWPLDVAGSWLLAGVLLSGGALVVRRWSGDPGRGRRAGNRAGDG